MRFYNAFGVPPPCLKPYESKTTQNTSNGMDSEGRRAVLLTGSKSKGGMK